MLGKKIKKEEEEAFASTDRGHVCEVGPSLYINQNKRQACFGFVSENAELMVRNIRVCTASYKQTKNNDN